MLPIVNNQDLLINPTEFFRDQVDAALVKQKLLVTDDVHYYMVNLLCEFISLSNLVIDEGDATVFDEPLALILKQALEAPPQRKAKIYKRLGDTSFFMAGFFQDFFNRKCFDSSYFITLGVNAYSWLSDVFEEQKHEDRFQGTYRSLALQLPKLVEVIAEVSEQPGNPKPSNILAIYDRWTKTGSDRLRQTLLDHGITPVPVSMKKAQ